MAKRKQFEKLYRTWASMKRRCLNPNCKDFPRYGGRGIFVCEKWLLFDGFLEDMKLGYEEHLTLDRIDTNGNYEKKNCRWITIKEQQNNRRDNVRLSFRGQTLTLAQWAEKQGIKYSTLKQRYFAYKWETEKCLMKGATLG